MHSERIYVFHFEQRLLLLPSLPICFFFFFANSRPNDTTLLLTTTLYKSLRYPTLVLYIHVSFSHLCNEFPSSLWASSSGVNFYLSYASFFATSSIIVAFLGPSFWALLEREKRPLGQRRQHQKVESLRGGCEPTFCSRISHYLSVCAAMINQSVCYSLRCILSTFT